MTTPAWTSTSGLNLSHIYYTQAAKPCLRLEYIVMFEDTPLLDSASFYSADPVVSNNLGMTSALNILTLNCWGLKYVAKDRRQRVDGIASRIAESNYDIVALQELWVFSDFEHVRTSVSKRLPYAKFFYSGALGAGLAMFSKFPIISASIHPYSLNGHPVDVAGGDWIVGKAAASIVIIHPILGEVEFFNTHLFAKGGEVGPEHLRAHRLVNAWEFAKRVRDSAAVGRYVIAAGDFNSIPTTLPMTIIREHANLVDAWAASHGLSPDAYGGNVTSEDAILRLGITADSPLNSYSAGKPLDATARKHLGKRLDYILYRLPFAHDPSHPSLKCTNSRVAFTDKVPGHSFSFSDHFGLEATIEIVTEPSSTVDEAESTPTFRSPTSLEYESIRSMSRALTACYRVSTHRSHVELSLFAICIAVLLAIAVGSAWLPHNWINPIFILFTIFVSWLGTTMLYAGFIYGNWERRALTNVIEELELAVNYKRMQENSSGSGI